MSDPLMASQPEKVHYRLQRFKGFLVTLLKNKMAFAGLVILVLYTFLAVAAPVLTPYDPQKSVVAGRLDQPSWVAALGEPGLSQNTRFGGLEARAITTGVTLTQGALGTDSINIAVSLD